VWPGRSRRRWLCILWSAITNGAAFGTDHFTRTAVARSNIFVNKAKETRYFYQDLDVDGARLNGASRGDPPVAFSRARPPTSRSIPRAPP
jgi:hypothetical protein